MIHGLWGSSAQFNSWTLGQRVLTIDLLGHGIRKENLDYRSISDYAYDAYFEISRRIPGEEFDLIGHSAGGLVGQILAAAYPKQVKSLTLVASSLPNGCGVNHLPFQVRLVQPNIFMSLMTGRSFKLTPGQERFCSQGTDVRLGTESGLALREILMCSQMVGPITCPIKVIGAEEDQFLPIDLQAKLADHYRTSLIRVPGTHMCHMHPRFRDRVVQEVKQHLAAVSQVNSSSN